MVSSAQRTLAELSLLSTDAQADMQSLFTTFIPRLGDELRKGWQTLLSYTPKEKIISNADRFIELVGKENYLDISSFHIACPEGLAVDYLTYTDVLAKAVEYALETQKTSVKNLKTHLSKMLNNSVISYSPSGLEKAITDRVKIRENIVKEIKGSLSNQTYRKMAYGNAINRNSDWVQVFKNIDKIQLLDSEERKSLAKDLSDVQELLDAVIAKVESPENKNVNKQAVKYTSDLVYAVAEEVKFVAQTYYLTESLVNRLSDGVDNTIKVFAKK
ncbi:MAG: hypothetical protein M0R77_00535 [Gammaproteobacteria bacterium]|nr:hypothetical protein [Acholeplasmataceae bacterium]MCK9529041.1 hypothetical protein [Gammaproteobacteria bacterium]